MQIVFHDHRDGAFGDAFECFLERQGPAEQCHAVAVRFRSDERQHRVPALRSECPGDIRRRLHQRRFAGLGAGDDQWPFGAG